MTGKTDYYCNQKFWWLNVDLEKNQQYSCCSAAPSQIDFSWLENNTGRLFNTPLLQQERTMMLSNLPVDSCQSTCFIPEQQGLKSRRLFEGGDLVTHNNVNSTVETLNIVMGSTCNLTCVYCCKQYSSAWVNDIKENGPYLNDNRYRLFPIDRARKHRQTQETNEYKLLEKELFSMEPKSVHISGGEPFLYNNLSDLVTSINSPEIKINTGLGVDPKRFAAQLSKIKHVQNLEILISAETQGALYEFVRYGNTYQNFSENLQTVIDSGLKYKFVSVVSNMTLLGLLEFYSQHRGAPWHFLLCNDPDYLGINVVDDATRQIALQKVEESDLPDKNKIIKNLHTPCTQQQQKNFSKYITEFAQRRNLSLDVLSPTLVQWINHGKNL